MSSRWVARLSLAAVAVIAATASYLHALVVVQAADGHSLVSWFIPVLADLVIASACANILDAAATGHDRPKWSVLAIAAGVAVTIGSNVMSSWPHDVPLWLVNAWPPIALLLSLESITGHVRRSRDEAEANRKAAELVGVEPEKPPLPVALGALCELYSERQIADLLKVPRSRVSVARKPAEPPVVTVAMNGSGPHA